MVGERGTHNEEHLPMVIPEYSFLDIIKKEKIGGVHETS